MAEPTAPNYKKTKSKINTNYGGQIKKTQTEYNDLMRANAVQKLINEAQVAKSMVNGGLNRTKQKKVQFSCANNNAEFKRKKQLVIQALTREMTAYLTEIDARNDY